MQTPTTQATTQTTQEAATTTQSAVQNATEAATQTVTEATSTVSDATEAVADATTTAGDSLGEASKLISDSLAVAGEAATKVQDISIYELVFGSGLASAIICVICFILLLISCYFFFERIFSLNRAANPNKKFNSDIHDLVSKGELDRAMELCDNTAAVESSMLKKGIARIGRPFDEINVSMENAAVHELSKLEKNVGFIATTSGAAPMLGFFGTVIGMIQVFNEIASSPGQAEVKDLADGIFTAMGTTAVGLAVGIPTYLMYNYLTLRTGAVTEKLQKIAPNFMDLINKPS